MILLTAVRSVLLLTVLLVFLSQGETLTRNRMFSKVISTRCRPPTGTSNDLSVSNKTCGPDQTTADPGRILQEAMKGSQGNSDRNFINGPGTTPTPCKPGEKLTTEGTCRPAA
uniref:Uncharacterized protein n=1 Tax=Cuerna arida TaxID=1464854 RepID=A0A1B6FY88_9HEMI